MESSALEFPARLLDASAESLPLFEGEDPLHQDDIPTCDREVNELGFPLDDHHPLFVTRECVGALAGDQ